MSDILSWRHCELVERLKSGTGPIPLPGSTVTMPRHEIKYMDSSDPFEKLFSQSDTREHIIEWLGSNGWELAAVFGANEVFGYYFKRAERQKGS